MKRKSRNEKTGVVVAVSGGFDPVHIGHVRMFNEAKKLGDRLVVIVNNDNWLKLKKGYQFMPEAERKEIIESFRSVDQVILTTHETGTTDVSVCRELRSLKPDIFANGGDRKAETVLEHDLCERSDIKMIFNVGAGGKMQSSSALVKRSKEIAAKRTTLAE
jgi:cytidyltransferase-like protein